MSSKDAVLDTTLFDLALRGNDADAVPRKLVLTPEGDDLVVRAVPPVEYADFLDYEGADLLLSRTSNERYKPFADYPARILAHRMKPGKEILTKLGFQILIGNGNADSAYYKAVKLHAPNNESLAGQPYLRFEELTKDSKAMGWHLVLPGTYVTLSYAEWNHASGIASLAEQAGSITQGELLLALVNSAEAEKRQEQIRISALMAPYELDLEVLRKTLGKALINAKMVMADASHHYIQVYSPLDARWITIGVDISLLDEVRVMKRAAILSQPKALPFNPKRLFWRILGLLTGHWTREGVWKQIVKEVSQTGYSMVLPYGKITSRALEHTLIVKSKEAYSKHHLYYKDSEVAGNMTNGSGDYSIRPMFRTYRHFMSNELPLFFAETYEPAP